MTKRRPNNKIKKLIELDRQIKKLPKLSPIEKELLDTEIRFEATYHSNRLEGNKLSEQDAREAITT